MRSFHIKSVLILGISTVFACMVGCASNTSGTAALTPEHVQEIKKGVTTRHEVETTFGPPQMVQTELGGKHIMSYSFSDTNAHANWMTFVPILNWFAAGAEGQSVHRSLQVNLTPTDIVEDYQFSDSASNVETRQGLFGSSVKSTPVSTPSP